jgi:hypothetical protein
VPGLLRRAEDDPCSPTQEEEAGRDFLLLNGSGAADPSLPPPPPRFDLGDAVGMREDGATEEAEEVATDRRPECAGEAAGGRAAAARCHPRGSPIGGGLGWRLEATAAAAGRSRTT